MTAAEIERLCQEYLLPYQGKTRQGYAHSLDLWFEWCTRQGLEPLTVRRVDVDRYIQHLTASGHRPAGTRYRVAPLRGLYRFAFLEGALPRDPTALARLPRVDRGPNAARCLDRREMRAFLDLGDRLGGNHQAIAYLLAYLGLRSAEVRSVRVESMQGTVRGDRVLEFIGKGGKPARIPLPAPVVEGLEAAAQGRTNGPLVLGRRGSPLSKQALLQNVKRMGVDAGISCYVHPRLLRASCITNALDSGAPLARVQELARHSTPRTTMGYDRNRTNLDDHAIHSLVSYLIPRDEDDPAKDEQTAASDPRL